MPFVRAIRTLNGVEAGTTDAAALETLLADAGRRAEFSGVLSMRGYARRVAEAASTMATIIGSQTALNLVMGSNVPAAELSSSPVAAPLLRASRAAMRAATSYLPGLRLWWNRFPWVARTSGVATQLNEVAFGNGVFVAVGNTGTILTSPDGIVWTTRVSATVGAANLVSVAFGAGYFVAIADSLVVTSPDGITWTAQTSPGALHTAYHVIFADGKFASVWYDGSTARPKCYYTANPLAWATPAVVIDATSSPQYAIAFGNGVWMTVGRYTSASTSRAYKSFTLATWIDLGQPVASQEGRSVVHTGDRFVVHSSSSATSSMRDGGSSSGDWVVVSSSGSGGLGIGQRAICIGGVAFVPSGTAVFGLLATRDAGLTHQSIYTNANLPQCPSYGGGMLLVPGANGGMVSNY